MEYFFVPGRMHELCEYEIDSLVMPRGFVKTFASKDMLHYTSQFEADIPAIVERSGGIYKAGVLESSVSAGEDKDAILRLIYGIIRNHYAGEGKLTFGVSVYGNKSFATHFGTQELRKLKDMLADEGISASYIEPEKGELSSVQVRKKGLLGKRGIEIVLSFAYDQLYLGRTLDVQDFDIWSAVDYNRPGVDPKSGMLPPKVARMILNIGLSVLGKDKDAVVLDPFCGSGTVLTEALRLGNQIIGSDNSAKAIEDTRNNIAWLMRQNFYSGNRLEGKDVKLYVSESAHIDAIIPSNSVDIIVTEPYMGPNFTGVPTPGKLERVIKGLEKLYIGSFKAFNHVLKNDGVLVFVEPQFFMPQKTYKIGIIDNPERFGYTLKDKILEYNREKALVGRRIGVLVKKK